MINNQSNRTLRVHIADNDDGTALSVVSIGPSTMVNVEVPSKVFNPIKEAFESWHKLIYPNVGKAAYRASSAPHSVRTYMYDSMEGRFKSWEAATCYATKQDKEW